MKKDTFYFQHDYNASTDIKCLFLRQALGMEGYGIYWFLVEQLANSGGFLPLSITPVLAMQIQVTEVKVQSVIRNFQLFTVDNENNFFSRRLNEHLEIRKTLSDSGKRGALNRWNKTEDNHPISHPISDPNAKERKIKEKEIKLKEKEKEKEDICVFNFKNELIKLGIENEIVSEWLKIRKKKNAINSEIAFNRVKKEIELSGLAANECIKIAVEKSWKGFEADWLNSNKNGFSNGLTKGETYFQMLDRIAKGETK